MSTSNFCEWYGIACDDAKSVVSIVLGSNNMKGSIPKEIFSLPNLQRLSIFSNPIDFSFDGIETAVNLKSLISDDESGSLSVEGVGKARSLTELNIRANGLVVGTLPEEIADLNNLRSLVVSDNKFTGTLPAWLTKLNKLTNLMLDNNQFTGTLIPFETYPDISLMSLSKNKLTGTIPG
jgi:Leucine-rich repeat (LRR) protein